MVEEVKGYHGVGGRSAGPFPGDELVAVAGELTSGLSYEDAIGRILSNPRPIALAFRSETWGGARVIYSVLLAEKTGVLGVWPVVFFSLVWRCVRPLGVGKLARFEERRGGGLGQCLGQSGCCVRHELVAR